MLFGAFRAGFRPVFFRNPGKIIPCEYKVFRRKPAPPDVSYRAMMVFNRCTASA